MREPEKNVWKIVSSQAIDPPDSAADCDFAVAFQLDHIAGGRSDVSIRYAAPSTATIEDAEDTIEPFLRSDAPPPTHLLVACDGTVTEAGW